MAGWKQRLAEAARRNRVELLEANLSRRDLFKLGLLTGSGFLVAKLGLSSRAVGTEASLASPATTPWVEELPIPPVAQARDIADLGAAPAMDCNAMAGEGARAAHQHWAPLDPAGTDFHLFENRATRVSWHRELPLDDGWCFNGMFPGPRIHARVGRPVLLRVRNLLPTLDAHRGYGRPTTATHLHGGHTGSESDGNPCELLEPGMWKDHLYLNAPAGFTEPGLGAAAGPGGTRHTLGYHDHCLGFSGQNVYRGNAGVYHLFDEFDSGDEHDPNPSAWRLPSGAFDVPLVLHDRVFDAHGKGYFDLFDLDGVVGDKLTVNGRIQPFMRVARRKYRFRLHNLGPSKSYDLCLSNDLSMVQVTHDGQFLPTPRAVKRLRLAVGQRADVILDLSRVAYGAEFYLMDRPAGPVGRGAAARPGPSAAATRLLQFRLDGALAANDDPSRVPDRFFDEPPADPALAVASRTFEFDRTDGGWSINGKPFDPNAMLATPRRGTAEIWTFVNRSASGLHAVHSHLEAHRVLSRNAKVASAEEGASGDLLGLAPGETVRVLRRFRDFLGRYPTHGLDAVNGDQGLMFMWKVVA